MKKFSVMLLFLSLVLPVYMLHGQTGRWQQKVKYRMDIRMNVETNRFTGRQTIDYWNNSPDTLRVIFYHLYWNAFQPGSMMDERSQALGKKNVMGRPDWDNRVRDRIAKLKPDEIGYQKVNSLRMNGRPQKTELFETILKVIPDKPVLPGTKVTLEMEFEAQVPVQVRRSGRDNSEGVRFSMSQWYPKLCEYDYEGWHPTPYVAREFYGVWGDFEVNITIDKKYIIGGTGYLQNPQEIGFGYETPGTPLNRPSGNTLTWKFVAPNVHDFVWAADPDYKHLTKKVRDGLVLHAFYKIDKARLGSQYASMPERVRKQLTEEQYINNYRTEWDSVLELAAKALPFIDKTFGKYPYRQYSFIQGGDGGMEYPMATLLKGAGQGVVIHEWMHSWYQMILGTNESLYAWMDEGFTSYAESRVNNYLSGGKDTYPHQGAFDSYIMLAKSEINEPLTTHADQYGTNTAYSINAYSKGEVFLEQLGYIVGAGTRDRILLEYFRRWSFKHPNVADFIRVAEDVSGIQLDWYRTFFVNTSKTIDYAVDSLWEEGGKMKVRLRNNGAMPMPVDVELVFRDGSREIAYIPQYLMFGIKQNEQPEIRRTVCEPWKWTHPVYTFELNRRLLDLKSLEIDPGRRTADMERKNNKLELNW
jgi:hypothetical protein